MAVLTAAPVAPPPMLVCTPKAGSELCGMGASHLTSLRKPVLKPKPSKLPTGL